MLPGYNHNIRYKEKVFHVQTEDNGLAAPDLVTQVFLGGQIVAIERSNYGVILAEKLEEKVRDQRIKTLMQEQHKRLLKNLTSGLYDAKIALFKTDTPPSESASAPPSPAASAASPFDAIQFEEPVLLEELPPEAARRRDSSRGKAAPAAAEGTTSGAAFNLDQGLVLAPRAEPQRSPEPASPAPLETGAAMDASPEVLESETLASAEPIDLDDEPDLIEIDPIELETLAPSTRPPQHLAGTLLPHGGARPSAQPQAKAPVPFDGGRTFREVPREAQRSEDDAAAGRTAPSEPAHEVRRISSETTDPPKVRPNMPDFQALDAAIAAAAEREGAPLPDRSESGGDAPFPLTDDLDIHAARRTKRLALDPVLEEPTWEPVAPAPKPTIEAKPAAGRSNSRPPPPPGVREIDSEMATWRGPIVPGSVDDDLPTQMLRLSGPPTPSRESTSRPPTARPPEEHAPKSSDTLVDFTLPAALRKELGDRHQKLREAEAQARSADAKGQDARSTPSNPRTANFRASTHEENRPSPSGSAPSTKERSVSEARAQLEESFRREAERVPSRSRGSANDTLVNVDRQSVAQKIAERARASLLNAHESKPLAPKGDEPSKPKPPAEAKRPSTPPSPTAPAAEDPLRPSLVVVERSLDEVILSYLHDDMAEE